MANTNLTGILADARDAAMIADDRVSSDAYSAAIDHINRGQDPARLRGPAAAVLSGSIPTIDPDALVRYRLLLTVLGVGPVAAARWTRAGIRSLADLAEQQLTTIQRYGLIHHADLQRRIPRAVITEFRDILTLIFARISRGVQFEIAGSYRREADSSGDIDVIYTATSRGAEYTTTDYLVAYISTEPWYVATLIHGSERAGLLVRLPTGVAQLDLLHVSPEHYPYALLYFTGSYEFNEGMRRWAKVRGYRLNQRELRDLKADVAIPAQTEVQIFAHLGLEYVPPRLRTGDIFRAVIPAVESDST